MKAARWNHLLIVKYLLDSKADKTAKNKRKEFIFSPLSRI